MNEEKRAIETQRRAEERRVSEEMKAAKFKAEAEAIGADAVTTGFGYTTDAASCGKASLLLRVGISCDKGNAACAVRGSPHASR